MVTNEEDFFGKYLGLPMEPLWQCIRCEKMVSASHIDLILGKCQCGATFQRVAQTEGEVIAASEIMEAHVKSELPKEMSHG